MFVKVIVVAALVLAVLAADTTPVNGGVALPIVQTEAKTCSCYIPVNPCCWKNCFSDPSKCTIFNQNPAPKSDPVVPLEPPQSPVGGKTAGDRCLGSAGYSWCASKSKCVQPWVETCPDIPVVPMPVAGAPVPGQQCLASAGYTWCAAKSKCVQTWVEPCTAPIGGEVPGDKCLGSAGYSWCASTQSCIRTWETDCPVLMPNQIGGLKPGEQCLSSAGYSWCEAKQKCLQPWNESC